MVAVAPDGKVLLRLRLRAIFEPAIWLLILLRQRLETDVFPGRLPVAASFAAMSTAQLTAGRRAGTASSGLTRSWAAALPLVIGGTRRILAAAVLAGFAAYLAHSLYDRDWNISALVLPALIFLGVLAGSVTLSGGRETAPGRGTHLVCLAAVTLWLCFFVVSALVPSIAANKASAALIEGASSSPGALDQAMSTARMASSLDPLSDAGLRAEASSAVRRGQLARARNYLQEALDRNPSDARSWLSLAELDLMRGDTPAARQAALRAGARPGGNRGDFHPGGAASLGAAMGSAREQEMKRYGA
jgi:Tetratricopeptide repeat